MVRVQDLKSGDPKFKSCPNHQQDLFQVVPGSTSWLCLYIMANWSTSCQILNLTSSFQWFVSLALKSPSGERSIIIKHTLHYIYITRVVDKSR